jgi:fermentation-respiration switch protein FrsA (DUF1100 family)
MRRRSAWIAFSFAGLLTLTHCGERAVPFALEAPLDAAKVTPPGEKGPYNVGFTIFEAPMSGGRLAKVQVFYPTLEPRDCATRYTVVTPPGPIFITSPLCAVEDAAAASGPFPLVAHDHGGGGAGLDHQRIAQAPVHEALASFGFVVAVALHSASAVARVRDLPLVIDTLLARSATAGDLLEGRVDPERIGIAGLSAGGATALRVAGGWAANGLAADPRARAMVVFEPAVTTLSDASTISIPYLVMGGTQFSSALGSPISPSVLSSTPRPRRRRAPACG